MLLSRPRHIIDRQCHGLSRQQSTLKVALRRAANSQNESRSSTQGSSKPPSWRPQTKPAFLPNSAEAFCARHLLRSILRECSYLPSTHARHYISQYTLSRFRESSFKAWNQARKPQTHLSLEDRLKAQEKEAKRAVTTLKRANEGERKCLLKVLLLAYGRVGKRRHELMRPLLPLRGPKGEQGGQNSKRESKLELTPQLRALLESQMKAKPPDLTRPNPRRLEADIPELNSWLRPMPLKRRVNAEKRHYALLLDRVLPPLPTDEWYQLRNLATGRTPPLHPMQRRQTTVPKGKGSALETVVQIGKVPKHQVFENREAHAMTPRFMRRLYAQVFSLCPIIQWVVETEEWRVRWGEQAMYDMGGPSEVEFATERHRKENREDMENSTSMQADKIVAG